MDIYIHDQNLANFRKILLETTDPMKRETVLKLLAAEQARTLVMKQASITSNLNDEAAGKTTL